MMLWRMFIILINSASICHDKTILKVKSVTQLNVGIIVQIMKFHIHITLDVEKYYYKQKLESVLSKYRLWSKKAEVLVETQ